MTDSFALMKHIIEFA